MLGDVRAAGGLVWRLGDDGLEVALIHRPRYDDWTFPKGKQDPGEHILVTAVREIAEETGIHVTLGRRLPSTRYLSGDRVKLVDYWAAQPAQAAPFTPGAEVDQLAWLPVSAAAERLSYGRDVKMLRAFTAGPVSSVPFIFLRHASALGKPEWRDAGNADDLTRPLSGKGLVEAQALGQVLACYTPAHVVSSPAERCLATVRPYAELTGAAIETEASFAVSRTPLAPGGEDWDATGAARQRITDLVAQEKPLIVCAHRQNLPCLLEWACKRLGGPVPDGPPLDRGDFWVLQVSGGRAASAEQHHLGV